MSEHWGIPGIGGSLGKCAVCGDAFAYEVLTGENVISFHMKAFKQTLYGHKKCADYLEQFCKEGKTWEELRDGPIKQAFQEAADKQTRKDETL